MKSKKIKAGIKASLDKSKMPTILASELSDYHAFNPATVSKIMSDRIMLSWPDGYSGWFDREAIVLLF
jgi:hypothetical protein